MNTPNINNINISHPFAGKTQKILKMKYPIFKVTEDNIPLASGYLTFSVDLGNNTIIEFNSDCTQEVFQEVVTKKLWQVNYIKIYLTFDDKGKAIAIEVNSDLPEGHYGFTIDEKEKEKLSISSIGDISYRSISDDPVAIFKTLSSKNKDGMYVEIKFLPKSVNKDNVAEILKAVNDRIVKKQSITERSILMDKYIVETITDNGKYLYIRCKPLS